MGSNRPMSRSQFRRWFALLLALSPAAVAGPVSASEALAPFAKSVFGDAVAVGEPAGEPPSRAVRLGPKTLGYVLSTHAVVASKGYSGRPFDIAVALDPEARIAGVSILAHREPILEIGVSDADLRAFVRQYVGHDVRRPARVERGAPATKDAYAAVSGATVSSVVLSDAIVRAARAVARSRGLIAADRLDLDLFRQNDWDGLLGDGSVARVALALGDVEAVLARSGGLYFPLGTRPDDPHTRFLDLYAALATPAGIGRNLLGARVYDRAAAALAEGDQLVFVAGRGIYSFKGTDYVRSGVFDRLQLVQGDKTIRFSRENHQRVDRVRADGVPELREAALFRIPRDRGFDPTAPWRLQIVVAARVGDNPDAVALFDLPYRVPEKFVRKAGKPAAIPPPDQLWRDVWSDRAADIGVLLFALAILSAVLFFQDELARRRRAYLWVRNGFLVFTLVWLGWYAGAQLSVLNVFTFAGALRTEFRWDFFLLDPLIFVLWSFVAVTLLFWGRGVFCGWLCPFGALQEILNALARRLRVPQLRLPFAVHERIWPLKYVVFVVLFGASLGAMGLAQAGIEVEPFKTAIVLHFVREWPFVAYAAALLAAGLVVERFFCRYLCPLGAALALPARVRMFDWLKRRWQCGLQCHICDRRCPVQAIHPDGRINPNECIHCLNCQVLYADETVCPPLVERAKRKRSRMTKRLAERFQEAERAGETEDKA